MEDLIRFRMLANQLSDTEFINFLSRYVAMKGRDILLRWIFNSKESENIADLTSIATQIITSRNTNNNNTTDNINNQEEGEASSSNTTPIKYESLNQLPSALISESASYLKAAEYIKFSRCSRKIYVSSYSPCKIYHMPTCLLKRFPTENDRSMRRLKCLKQLGLNIKYFNDSVSIQNQQTWQNVKLHTLQLSNRGGNENDIMTFCNRNLIKYTQNLKLHKFGKSLSNRYQSKYFHKLLEKFSSITHLLLWDVYLTDDYGYIDDEIREWLPNLKGFGFTGGSNHRLSTAVIKALSNQLEALRIEGLNMPNMSHDNMENHRFTKLKELSLSMCNSEILSMFEDVKTLECVMISSSKEEIIREFVRMMINKEFVKHIHIKSPAKLLQFAMEQTESMLFSTLNTQRRNGALCIIFDGNNWDREHKKLYSTRDENDGLDFVIFRLLNALEKGKMNDFILRIKITSQVLEINEKDEDVKRWIDRLDLMKRSYLTHYEFSIKKKISTFIFTISNIGCKINGYRYCWKMWSSSL